MSSIPAMEERRAAMRKPKAPQANRARILQAAIDEFAARGVKGASMDAIAARTNTTRAMINYYFGAKEKLYLAVLEHVYAGIRQAESRLDLDHLAPEAAIRRVVDHTFNYYLANVGFCRLVVAENQARGRYLRRSKTMRTLNRTVLDTLGRILERGRADGTFRRDVEPLEVHKVISALGLFNITNEHTFGTIFQCDMGARGDVARRRRIVSDMILSYLKNE